MIGRIWVLLVRQVVSLEHHTDNSPRWPETQQSSQRGKRQPMNEAKSHQIPSIKEQRCFQWVSASDRTSCLIDLLSNTKLLCLLEHQISCTSHDRPEIEPNYRINKEFPPPNCPSTNSIISNALIAGSNCVGLGTSLASRTFSQSLNGLYLSYLPSLFFRNQLNRLNDMSIFGIFSTSRTKRMVLELRRT